MGYFVSRDFLHEQTTPASVWVVKHACGNPVVDVYVSQDGEMIKMLPESVKFISASQCEIHFTGSYTGIAKISG